MRSLRCGCHLFWNLFSRKLGLQVWHLTRVFVVTNMDEIHTIDPVCFRIMRCSISLRQHWRTTFNWNRAPEVKILFLLIEKKKSEALLFPPGEALLLLPFRVFIVSKWTCTDTAGSSWWGDSWTMAFWKSQTCPTSTRQFLTAAITELWRTGSASWSRDSWLSLPSARWCVSTRTGFLSVSLRSPRGESGDTWRFESYKVHVAFCWRSGALLS